MKNKKLGRHTALGLSEVSPRSDLPARHGQQKLLTRPEQREVDPTGGGARLDLGESKDRVAASCSAVLAVHMQCSLPRGRYGRCCGRIVVPASCSRDLRHCLLSRREELEAQARREHPVHVPTLQHVPCGQYLRLHSALHSVLRRDIVKYEPSINVLHEGRPCG